MEKYWKKTTWKTDLLKKVFNLCVKNTETILKTAMLNFLRHLAGKQKGTTKTDE